MATANAATTTVNNLVQGVYQFQLTVTDDNGDTGKDTIIITVNAAVNQVPAADAGPDNIITLPLNSITLTGAGTDVDGTISSYAWVKISGPSTGTIATANAATTTVNNLVQGVYQFQLTVTDDKGDTGKDTIIITVNAAVNQVPAADAGPDNIITLPLNSITLTGAGTDADGTISSYAWVKISGPGNRHNSNCECCNHTVNNLVQGVYQFQLTVTDDNGDTGKDTIIITVNAAVNQVPAADAGPDNIITLPLNSITLTGTGTDADGTISSYAWVKISGPSTGTITTANAATTTVNNLVQGVYQFQLTVTDDNGDTGTDTIIITVNAAVNQVPAADAGPDNIITLPLNSITLTGTGTDADGTISSYAWVKISGPSTGTIATANAATTTVNNLVQGVYKFQLTVTDDNGDTGKDTIIITVNAAVNQVPAADAGPDNIITLPLNSITLTGAGTDVDGTISSYAWLKISGPSSGTIATANAATTTVNNLVQGVYKFQLTVTDDNGDTGKDTIIITVNAAVNQSPGC